MTNTTRIRIICKETKGILAFYACFGNEEMFLFNQRYDQAVYLRFRRGVELGEALTPIKCRGRNTPLEKVSDKLPAYIRFAEQEYGVSLLHGRCCSDKRVSLREKAEKNDIRYAA